MRTAENRAGITHPWQELDEETPRGGGSGGFGIHITASPLLPLPRGRHNSSRPEILLLIFVVIFSVFLFFHFLPFFSLTKTTGQKKNKKKTRKERERENEKNEKQR